MPEILNWRKAEQISTICVVAPTRKLAKEVCLLNQEFIQDAKMTVADYLKSQDKDLAVTAFKRFTLRAE